MSYRASALHRANAEFFVPVPDDPAITEPRGTIHAGPVMHLTSDLLGTVRL